MDNQNENVQKKLETLAKARIDGRTGYQIVYFQDLNPEQKLAYVLEQLVELNKGKLALMETTRLLAQECVEWKKTPEGQAWNEKMRVKRAEKEKADGRQAGTKTS